MAQNQGLVGSSHIIGARDFFSGQWRLRRLFGKWIKEKDIAQEDIPSTEALKQITKEGKPPAYQPTADFSYLGSDCVCSLFYPYRGYCEPVYLDIKTKSKREVV